MNAPFRRGAFFRFAHGGTARLWRHVDQATGHLIPTPSGLFVAVAVVVIVFALHTPTYRPRSERCQSAAVVGSALISIDPLDISGMQEPKDFAG